MNLHSFYFRMPIKIEFEQEEFDRFIYFERLYGGIGGVRPNTISHINYERTVSNDERTIAITYRDDGMIDLNWVRVSYLQPDHPEAKQAFETAVTRIQEKVPTYSLHELQSMYQAAPSGEDGARLFAVYATCVAAPWAFDPAYLKALETYAQDAKATVRSGLVIGIGYTGWTECEPLLQRLAKDPVEDVRERALSMLEDFDALKATLTT